MVFKISGEINKSNLHHDDYISIVPEINNTF